MHTIKIAIAGHGNLGRGVEASIAKNPDMQLVGIYSRRPPADIQPLQPGTPVHAMEALPDHTDRIDVLILCGGSKEDLPAQGPAMAALFNTVDSFDIHDKIVDLRRSLGAQAIKHNSVAVISAGWDPGTDSVMRSMMLAMAPKGITYTNFGPGMSMGHSVVARSKEGVEDALSLTIPTGSGIHRRMVYVVLKEGAKFSDVELAIKSDSYFSHDDTRVQQVPDIDALKDMGHGVLMERKGVSGTTQNQMFKFEMRINNPALTAQVMVASARASMKLGAGCYTLPEIAPMDFLPGDREELIAQLV